MHFTLYSNIIIFFYSNVNNYLSVLGCFLCYFFILVPTLEGVAQFETL